MLLEGSENDMKDILKLTDQDVQKIVISVTFPQKVAAICKQYLIEPAFICVKNEELTLDGIKQYYAAIDKEEWKYDVFMELFSCFDFRQIIVYCNQKQDILALENKFKENHYHILKTVLINYGEMDAKEIQSNLRDFRNGSCRVLITDDLIIREKNVQIANFSLDKFLPSSKEVYLGRIGRSGCFGRKVPKIRSGY